MCSCRDYYASVTFMCIVYFLYFAWAHQKRHQCFIHHTAQLLYRVMPYGYYQRYHLLSRDHIKDTALCVLVACVQNTEWRAVSSLFCQSKASTHDRVCILQVFADIVFSPPAKTTWKAVKQGSTFNTPTQYTINTLKHGRDVLCAQ